jgi:adenylate cyclase class 2
VSRSEQPVETEIKLKTPSAEAAGRLLESAGFRISHRRALETNQLYDTPEESLRRSGKLLRLRSWDGVHVLTFKGRSVPGRHKSREEIETGFEDPARMAAILERLGMVARFRYEKFRTVFEIPSQPGCAVVDETPIGVFLELEGDAAWIDATALQLGFSPADYITVSYGTLYLEHCRRQGLEAGDMVFPVED